MKSQKDSVCPSGRYFQLALVLLWLFGFETCLVLEREIVSAAGSSFVLSTVLLQPNHCAKSYRGFAVNAIHLHLHLHLHVHNTVHFLACIPEKRLCQCHKVSYSSWEKDAIELIWNAHTKLAIITKPTGSTIPDDVVTVQASCSQLVSPTC